MNFLTTPEPCPNPARNGMGEFTVLGRCCTLRVPDLSGVWRKEGRLIPLSPGHWEKPSSSSHVLAYESPQKRSCQENVSEPFGEAA